ncbi:MAG: hypothetical protein GY820_03260 [Gammaproteobacteria bacterium]|nr:hypothetical protein [Gammaproteobacteria bacterium]
MEEKKQSELPLVRIERASVKSFVCSLFSRSRGENRRVRESDLDVDEWSADVLQ